MAPNHPSPESAEELFQRAKAAAQAMNTLSALRLAEEAAAIERGIPGLHVLRAQCLAGLGRLDEALAAASEDQSPEANLLLRSIEDAIRSAKEKARAERQWASIIKPDILRPIEAASHRYTYRGHALIKNPFDFALYPLLLWNLRPASVFEIGSYNGASALWMADTLRTYGIKSHITSLDVVKVTAIQDPDITFLAGSGREPQIAFPEQMLAASPRPWLVIEDADHSYETSKAVLEYFHPHMESGDYFVIEDGATAEGPRLALAEFLPAHKDEYEVDSAYCDFFGYNATWCINGFLRRK